MTGRRPLPKATDRLPLGQTGLSVSPVCIGATRDAETIPAAFDAGINFFFLSADLHWPIYEGTRQGLRLLLERGSGVRDRIVVAIVSYLEEPLFQAMQFHEVTDAVPGLDRVDVLTAGAFSDEQPLYPRLRSLHAARGAGYMGARGVAGTFHSRAYALQGANQGLVDVGFIRYNNKHGGARQDVLPWLRADRQCRIFSFKSTMYSASPEKLDALGLPPNAWRPAVTDYYRYVLGTPGIDGFLCSPFSAREAEGIAEDLNKGALTQEEDQYLSWLGTLE